MMWFLIILFFLFMLVAAVMLLDFDQQTVAIKAEADKVLEDIYQEDIDFSLMAKGYPMVNDADIAYTNYLGRNPHKINL